MTDRSEWLVLLEPFGDRLYGLIEAIEQHVETLNQSQLDELLRACRTAKGQPDDEIPWAVLKVAPLVERIATVELSRREGRATIRESLSL